MLPARVTDLPKSGLAVDLSVWALETMMPQPPQPPPSLAILYGSEAVTPLLAPLASAGLQIRFCPPGELQSTADALIAQGVCVALRVTDAPVPGQPSISPVLRVDELTSIEPAAATRRIRQVLTEYLVRYHPAALPAFPELLDLATVAQLLSASEVARHAMERQVKTARRSFLAATELSDEAVEQAMLAGIDRALGHLPQVKLSVGAILLEEDCPVRGLWIILEGKVSLSRRGDSREVIFHSKTTGRIVGLLALAQRQSAFFTCRAATDVTAISVSWEELDEAMQTEPTLSMHFVTVLVRSMSNRLRRIAELQLEIDDLNAALRLERDQLTSALQRLEDAQARLIQSEKMATLGQLSAGVAHELNNPITAIRRAADHVAEDLAKLLTALPDALSIQSLINNAAGATPLPTAEIRALRNSLALSVRDEGLAGRLVNIGLTTPEQYARALAGVPEQQRSAKLEQLEIAHQLGGSLRSIRTCSDRVAAIVRSLKNYARPGNEAQPDIDIHEGIQDSLLLFKSSLHDIQIESRFGNLARISCRPAELSQLWTNLLSNAIEAVNGKGSISIETSAPDPAHVQVVIVDSGPGIAPENLARVFEPNFTTKFGKSNFGLGMGLVICRQIVERHDGTVRIESQPGRTAVIVTLPIQPPNVTD